MGLEQRKMSGPLDCLVIRDGYELQHGLQLPEKLDCLVIHISYELHIGCNNHIPSDCFVMCATRELQRRLQLKFNNIT
jgi:hypothetical protein